MTLQKAVTHLHRYIGPRCRLVFVYLRLQVQQKTEALGLLAENHKCQCKREGVGLSCKGRPLDSQEGILLMQCLLKSLTIRQIRMLVVESLASLRNMLGQEPERVK